MTTQFNSFDASKAGAFTRSRVGARNRVESQPPDPPEHQKILETYYQEATYQLFDMSIPYQGGVSFLFYPTVGAVDLDFYTFDANPNLGPGENDLPIPLADTRIIHHFWGTHAPGSHGNGLDTWFDSILNGTWAGRVIVYLSRFGQTVLEELAPVTGISTGGVINGLPNYLDHPEIGMVQQLDLESSTLLTGIQEMTFAYDSRANHDGRAPWQRGLPQWRLSGGRAIASKNGQACIVQTTVGSVQWVFVGVPLFPSLIRLPGSTDNPQYLLADQNNYGFLNNLSVR